MSTPNTIIINDVSYIRADSIEQEPSAIQIVVVEGRWNIVGRVTDTDSGISIHNAHVIRYWGTTKGLGEIALSGPTSKTILDPTGRVDVPLHSIIMRINTDEKAWTTKVNGL